MARSVRRTGNLPAEATSFVGRRRELGEIKAKLAAARLVTLVGPGGVGKTRIALRAASELGRGFRDGGWLVELAEVREEGLIGTAAAAALGLRPQAATEPRSLVLSFLKDRQLLLVVDNCEHLLTAVARLTVEILASCPSVRILATSREPLSIAGEHVVPVPPLELPSPMPDEPLAHLRQKEAVMLFVDRAAAATGAFELTEANRKAVIDVCRRLDGLPLAIELAAVRTRALGLQQLVDRLADRFDLLTKGSRAALPRHQTLRTTIDWSYELLSAEERLLMRRLCVFAGRFTLEDVEGVCLAHALEPLTSLVDKSMVSREEAGGTACYRLHETMREYARLRLREADEEASTEESCLEHYRLQTRRFGPDPRRHLLELLAWIELEIDNLRAILRRCVEVGDFARGTELAISMGWFWIVRATTEGVRWLEQLLLPADRGSPEQVWAYFMYGFLSILRADAGSAEPWLARAVSAARSAGDPAVLVHSVSMAAIAQRMVGERESAASSLAEARSVVESLDDPAAVLAVLQARAINGFFDGDLDEVREATSTGIRIARETNDLYVLDVMLGELGGTALMAGDFGAARPLYVEGLHVARQIDDRVTEFYFVDALACIAASSGKARLAAQLLGAARTMKEAAGAEVLAFMSSLLEQAEEVATSSLGARAFQAEVEAGRRLSHESALRLALGESPPASTARGAGAEADLLGRRESEVARLIADGLSNKEIATRLFISKRTVDTHVRNILDKLGFNSRTQIAAWVAGR